MTYWIIDKQLGIINMLENATEAGTITIDVRDLLDGSGNEISEVANKIQLVANLMCSGHKVIVRCQAGMSRSTTIATAAMLYTGRELYWDKAWKLTSDRCPRAKLNLEFFDTIKMALIQLSQGYKNNGLSMGERLGIIKDE
jgi:protein-tyrosine phosphatase